MTKKILFATSDERQIPPIRFRLEREGYDVSVGVLDKTHADARHPYVNEVLGLETQTKFDAVIIHDDGGTSAHGREPLGTQLIRKLRTVDWETTTPDHLPNEHTPVLVTGINQDQQAAYDRAGANWTDTSLQSQLRATVEGADILVPLVAELKSLVPLDGPALRPEDFGGREGPFDEGPEKRF